MPIQPRESKNYIRIVSDETDPQRAVDPLEQSNRFARKYFLGFMAAIFNRDFDRDAAARK